MLSYQKKKCLEEHNGRENVIKYGSYTARRNYTSKYTESEIQRSKMKNIIKTSETRYKIKYSL